MIAVPWISFALVKCKLVPLLKVCLPEETEARYFSTAEEAQVQKCISSYLSLGQTQGNFRRYSYSL